MSDNKPRKGHSGNGNTRARGDWIAIAAGRDRAVRDGKREIINGRGVSNVPQVTDVGSAAYRRRKAKKGDRSTKSA